MPRFRIYPHKGKSTTEADLIGPAINTYQLKSVGETPKKEYNNDEYVLRRDTIKYDNTSTLSRSAHVYITIREKIN